MPKIEDFENQPILGIHLEWEAQNSNLSFKRNCPLDQKYPLTLDLAIHPNNSGRIIINYPGYRGAIDGFNDKHKNLARYMQGEALGAVIRSKGPGFSDFDGFSDDVALRKMIDYSLENSEMIAGVKKPELLLIGTSAGGGAAAAVAASYEEITRILLMAPGANIGAGEIRRGLQQFSGEVFIVIGQNDENVGVRSGESFYNLATGASRRELHIIPNCDHQFRGEINGKIMSQAPFYAFAKSERPKFPDFESGMVLY